MIEPARVLASVPDPEGGRYVTDVGPEWLAEHPEGHLWPCLCVECLPLSRAVMSGRCSPLCEAAHPMRRLAVHRDCGHRVRAVR